VSSLKCWRGLAVFLPRDQQMCGGNGGMYLAGQGRQLSLLSQSSQPREFGLGGQVFPFRVSPPQKPPHVVARHVLLFCAFIAFHFTPMLCTSPLAIPLRIRQQARDKERIVCDAIYSGKQTLVHTTPPPRTINIWTCSLGSLHLV
jgi:hypothetical protein